MKIFLSIFIFIISSLSADILTSKIENLIDSANYQKHKNLIDNITQDRKLFYYNDKQLNYNILLNVLRKNGLLNLRYNKPKEVKIEFIIEQNPLLSMKIIKDVLRNLGYSYYFTDYLRYNNGILNWQIVFKSEYMLDPYIFNNELRQNEMKIVDITKISKTVWRYKFNSTNAKLQDAIKVQKDEKIKFLKPLKPYLIRVDNPKEIKIVSRKLNHWFAKLTLYTKDLKLLGSIKKRRIYRGIRLKLPEDTYYILIDDSYTLLNIKRGLTIIVK